MKTIGIIGGMSWESSKVYYEVINTRVKELLGDTHSCKSLMVSVDFADIVRYTNANDWESMGKMMAECAQQLEKGGADIVLLATNTIHLVSDAIVNNVDIPFLHIAEATGQAIQQKGMKKVGLIGTKFTMEKDFYTGYLKENFDIDVIIPSDEERQVVHDMIYYELVKGVFTEEAKVKCLKMITNMALRGAEGAILGCTELPILIPEVEVMIPTFDTGKIHAYKAVDWAINN